MRKLLLLIAAIILILLIILLLKYCTKVKQSVNFSGVNCVYIDEGMPTTLQITQNNSNVNFELVTSEETIQGTGSVNGQQMSLIATFSQGLLTMELVFTADGQNFSGNYAITGTNPQQGTLTGNKGDCVFNVPDISIFNQTKSDTFVVPLSELGNRVAGIAPMPGSNSSCYHPGAHVVYAVSNQLDSVDIIAPADGFITMIDKCFNFNNDTQDQYKIHMAYAQKNGALFELELGIEPQAGVLCSNGNPDYFAPYIAVAAGEQVSKGQKLGEMVLVPGHQAHIHMNSKYKGTFMCPDIFNTSVIDTIDDYYNGIPDTCNGTPYENIASGTICYNPEPGESHNDY